MLHNLIILSSLVMFLIGLFMKIGFGWFLMIINIWGALGGTFTGLNEHGYKDYQKQFPGVKSKTKKIIAIILMLGGVILFFYSGLSLP